MGVVYEARDRARDMIVALKALRTHDANLLYHFKNEVRSIAELATVRSIAGTPAYMAPEQGIPGAVVGTSADWYAVGVMLYLVLADRMPFTGGSVHELIAAKQSPPPPLDRFAGVPTDLAELCVQLLAPDPRARPTGADVLR